MGNLLLNFSVKNATTKYTYSDLAIPVTYDNRNLNAETIIDAAAIKNSIRNIFEWFPGERIILPEFGNLLYEHLYTKINELSAKNIAVSVRQMLRWEPRISVTQVDVIPDAENNQYDVNVVYEIPQLKSKDVYTVKLSVIT